MEACGIESRPGAPTFFFNFGYDNIVSEQLSLAMMQEKRLPVVFDTAYRVTLPDGQCSWLGGMRAFVPRWARSCDSTQQQHRQSDVADMKLFIVQGIKKS